MSDSDDSDFDFDFITSSSCSLTRQAIEMSAEEMAGGATGPLDNSGFKSPDVATREDKENKRKSPMKRVNNSVEASEEKGGSPCKTSRCSITPPPSPSHQPLGRGGKPRAVRGAARTKKTVQALKAIQSQMDRLKDPPATANSPPSPPALRGRRARKCKAMARREQLRNSVDSVKGKDKDKVVISDDEEQENNSDGSFDIKVHWKTDVLRVKVKDTDRIGFVMDAVAERVSLQPGELGFIKQNASLDADEEVSDENWIGRDKTVAALQLSIVSILTARARDLARPSARDLIELKVQTKDRRGAVNIQLKKTDKMEVLMDKFCQMKGIEKASARFYFDGEDLEPSDTSETLDLEGGECIDVHINE